LPVRKDFNSYAERQKIENNGLQLEVWKSSLARQLQVWQFSLARQLQVWQLSLACQLQVWQFSLACQLHVWQFSLARQRKSEYRQQIYELFLKSTFTLKCSLN